VGGTWHIIEGAKKPRKPAAAAQKGQVGRELRWEGQEGPRGMRCKGVRSGGLTTRKIPSKPEKGVTTAFGNEKTDGTDSGSVTKPKGRFVKTKKAAVPKYSWGEEERLRETI